MKKILLSFCLVMSEFALAQGGMKGGGFGLVRKDQNQNILSAQSLDLWEAKHFYPALQIDLGSKNLTTGQKVDYVLNRFAKLDPVRAAAIKQYAKLFLEFAPDVVEKVDHIDSDQMTTDTAIPVPFIALQGYTPVQACIQNRLAFFGLLAGMSKFIPSLTLTLNMSVWEKMDADNQAALVLHEAIYQLALLQYGHLDSNNVREFNAFVMSKNLKDNPNEEDVGQYHLDYVQRLNMGSNL